jgi:hypothetical protein
VSTANHSSWWVHFTSAPSASVTSLLARLGVGWGYSATPPFAKGADAHLNPATMTTAQLIRAGLPLPQSSPGTSAYATWLKDVRAELPLLHVSAAKVPSVVSPVQEWYQGTEPNSQNWSGYEEMQNTYTGIQAQFHMADTAYSLSSGQGIAEWVGLGGDPTFGSPTGLVQAGAYRANSGGVSGNNQSALFIMALSQTNGTCYNYTTGGASPGDDIWAQVDFQGVVTINGTSWSKYKAISEDPLNGDNTGWQYFSCQGSYPNSTADSILEAPLYNGYILTLPSWSNTTPFFNVYAYNSAGEVNGQVAPYYLVEMRNSAGFSATPTGWSSQTAFGVDYGT